MPTGVLIEVTILDADEVQKQIVKFYGGSYGFEVERIFSDLGSTIAKIIEPDYDT